MHKAGPMAKFPKMPRLLWPMGQTETEIIEISHLAIHRTLFSVQGRGRWQNFLKCHDFTNNFGVYMWF